MDRLRNEASDLAPLPIVRVIREKLVGVTPDLGRNRRVESVAPRLFDDCTGNRLGCHLWNVNEGVVITHDTPLGTAAHARKRSVRANAQSPAQRRRATSPAQNSPDPRYPRHRGGCCTAGTDEEASPLRLRVPTDDSRLPRAGQPESTRSETPTAPCAPWTASAVPGVRAVRAPHELHRRDGSVSEALELSRLDPY